MATLTKSTGTVALSGAVEKVTLPAVYGWVWVKNMSDADMFVGLSDGVSAGADGVLAIPAGECGRVQTDGQDSVYILGSGNALVVAQNYADCPFKVGGKGGEIPDLSAYAKKTDVPNIKVNAAVNADTVGEKSVSDFIYPRGILSNVDLNDVIYPCSALVQVDCINMPTIGLWGTLLCYVGGTGSVAQIFIPTAVDGTLTNMWIRHFGGTGWTLWAEIYTSGNKPYVTGSVTVAANSQICVTNHGFMPSAVIWWDSNGSNGVAVSFDDSQFIINVISTGKMTINYMIFK